MALVVFEQDLLSGKYTIANIIREALSELPRIERAFRTLQSEHRDKRMEAAGITLMTLHQWMISLNESYVGALHLSWGNEVHAIKDKQFVDGLKLEIDSAHEKWGRLIESAYRLRDLAAAGRKP